ncbi:hypothetical protein KCU99_g3609, partial [Aureobasidium melanogenum]
MQQQHQHQGTPIHGSKQQATPKFGSQHQGPSKSQSNQVETPSDQPEPKKKKRKSSNHQKQQEDHQTTQDEKKANSENQLVRLEQPEDQPLELPGQDMNSSQVTTNSEREQLWKKLEDNQSGRCCVHCKDNPKLGLEVMQEQHEQLVDEVKEEFTTVKKERTLINIKVDTYKAGVGMLKKQFNEQETNLKNLLADFKELQNDFEEQYEDCVNLVSRWFREERETRREEIDETRKEITGHDKQLIRMQNEIAEYSGRVTEAETEVIRFRERLTRVAEGCAGHDRQLAKHSQRLAEHHDRHTVHDDRHDSHEERLTGLDTQLLGHGERLAEHNEQLFGLGNRLSAYDDQSAGFDRNLTELNAWRLEMEKRVTEVEKRDNERKESYDNLKEQYDEQQKLTKRLSDQVDDLNDRLAEACEARDRASEENQAYVDLIAKERTEISRLEQKVETALEEQKKMRQDYQKYQARIGATVVEKSRADIVVFKAQATKIEALESQTRTLTSLVEQLQTHLAQLTHLPIWTKNLEQDTRPYQRPPVQAPDLEARVRMLEEQSVQHTGLKDWQARMELYFHGTRDTMFTWTRGELKEHHSSLIAEIESVKAQSDCREKDVRMMSKRLEDQDLKFLTLRALLLGKTNQPSTQDAFTFPEKVIEGQLENDATWNSSPTLMMADEDLNQQAGEDAVPQMLIEPDAGPDEEDSITRPEMDVEHLMLDLSSVLYDPSREIPREPSPPVEETAQTPSSPLSSIRTSIIDEAEDSAEPDKDYAMPDVSVYEEDSQFDQEEDSANEPDGDSNDPVHALSSTRKDGWSELEIEIVQNTMNGSENYVISMAERYRLCQQRLSEKGFTRSSSSCQQLWNNKLVPADRRKARHWSERELEIVRDTMCESEDQDTLMPERYRLCEQRLREKGFKRTSGACQKIWHEILRPDEFRGRYSNWSKKELEILQDTMDESVGDHRPKSERYLICQKRLEEKGFKRSAYACKKRWTKDGAEGAEEDYVWTEDQIRLLGKAFQATIGAYGQSCSHQRFKRISEMLNSTGEIAVHLTRKACMEQWYRMPAEERWRIEEMIPIPRKSSPGVPGLNFSMPLVSEDSNFAKDVSAEHTEQATYLLGHLTSDCDAGASQESQKQNSSHIDQSALFNAERGANAASVAPISACQGPITSPPNTGTSSRLPIIEVTEILPQSQNIEQLPDTGRTTQVEAEKAMDEQAMKENPGAPTAIAATTESVAEQHEADKSPEATQGEPREPFDFTQNPSQTPAATVNIEPANFRHYEWMQMHSEPDPSAEGHTTDRMTHDGPSTVSVDRSGGGEGEPPESISAADLAAAVAEEIAEHCEQTTTGWGPMDIGFWIADSN